MKRSKILTSFILSSFIILSTGCATATNNTSNVTTSKTVQASVVRVVDGDTFVAKINGKEEKVRLLLVDTPETVKPNTPAQPFGKEASNYAKQTLTGKSITLESEPNEQPQDKYGRKLYYVFLNGSLFEEYLVNQGLARVTYYHSSKDKYLNQLLDEQEKAKDAKKGIWSIPNYVQKDGFHPPEK